MMLDVTSKWPLLASFLLVPACGEDGGIGESVADVAPDPDAPDEPRPAVTGAGDLDCRSEPVASCERGWTGPNCDHACDPGAPSCGFRHYCHADGRIAGIALSRAHLFAFGPSIGPLALRDRLEQWVTAYEDDLDMADGLTSSMLALEPADDSRVEQGLLTLHRFRQRYPVSPHVSVPVVGDGALLTLKADGKGAVALLGTLVDPRVQYAHASEHAPAAQARESITRHASLRTGIPRADIEVDALQRVALPWAEQIAWYGIPRAGAIPMGPSGSITWSRAATQWWTGSRVGSGILRFGCEIRRFKPLLLPEPIVPAFSSGTITRPPGLLAKRVTS